MRREGDSQLSFPLHAGLAGDIKVSPDGRRIAYWTPNELRVLDVLPDARPRTLLIPGSKESGGSVAWSNDGTGLVVGVLGPGTFPDAPPLYTSIRVIDLAGGSQREVVRVPNAAIVLLAWDRSAQLISGHEPTASGTRVYDTFNEHGILQREKPASEIYFPRASDNGQQVFGRSLEPAPRFGSSMLRVWPAGSFAGGVELRAAAGQTIRAAEWRPGTSEIGVLFDDHLEFWDASGARRVVQLPSLPPLPATNPNATLLFRAEGKVVFIGLQQVDTSAPNVYVLAVDIASGQTAVVDWSGELPEPGTSVRVGL